MSTKIYYTKNDYSRVFPSTDKNQDNIRLKLLFVSQSSYGNDWISVPHTHNFVELLFVTKGQGFFLAKNIHIKKPISKGSLLIVNNLTLHTEISDKDNHLEYFTLGFKGMNFNTDQNDTMLCVNNEYDEFYNYFKTMIKNCESDTLFAKELTYNTFINLIIRIIELSSSNYQSEQKLTHPEELDAVINYIDANYFYPISLNELAKISNLSNTQIIRLFNKWLNCTPIAYVIKKRISIAKELLINTTNSISNISYTVGFNSTSNFINKFKELESLSPKEFRQKNSLK